MRFNKKNWMIYLAVFLPLILIIITALSFYWPNLHVHPHTDFVYQQNQYGGDKYQIIDGKISLIPFPNSPVYPPPIPSESKLFYYDVVNNKSHELSFSAAQAYTFDSGSVSADGFHIEHGGGGLTPFFSSDNYNRLYLVGHGLHRELQIFPDNYNLTVLGWIKK